MLAPDRVRLILLPVQPLTVKVFSLPALNRPPVDASVPPLVGFVAQTKRGYCQHFAGAMALMLRYLGVSARVAVGFMASSYQGIGVRSRKNPPVGPSSGSVASQTTVSAPSSTLRGACGPPIFVRTHPGQAAFTLTLACRTSSATIRDLRDGPPMG